MATECRLDANGILILARSIPGMAAIIFALLGQALPAGFCLVLAVWSDAVLGIVTKACAWQKRPFHVQLDGFVDLLCFIWAPVQFIMLLGHGPFLIAAIPVLVLAGIFRLARFNIEGLVESRYRGLPVTYNGYIFPVAALLAHYGRLSNPEIVFAPLMLIVAALMVSTRLKIPEL